MHAYVACIRTSVHVCVCVHECVFVQACVHTYISVCVHM